MSAETIYRSRYLGRPPAERRRLAKLDLEFVQALRRCGVAKWRCGQTGILRWDSAAACAIGLVEDAAMLAISHLDEDSKRPNSGGNTENSA